jgi:hypothetical protein
MARIRGKRPTFKKPNLEGGAGLRNERGQKLKRPENLEKPGGIKKAEGLRQVGDSGVAQGGSGIAANQVTGQASTVDAQGNAEAIQSEMASFRLIPTFGVKEKKVEAQNDAIPGGMHFQLSPGSAQILAGGNAFYGAPSSGEAGLGLRYPTLSTGRVDVPMSGPAFSLAGGADDLNG